MPELLDLLEEASREFAICNSCRYCEGYCPVFPAVETMPAIRVGDLALLSNLCHECRACYQACMYAPPHEFGVNIPAVLTEGRVSSYAEGTWPSVMRSALRHPWRTVGGAGAVGLVLVLLAIAVNGGIHGIFGGGLLTAGGLVLGLLAVLLLLVSFWRSWRLMGGSVLELVHPRWWWRAGIDALGLRFQRGGGGGCYYPQQSRASRSRRLLHQAVVVGFALAFAATVAAAFEEHVLEVLPPYPLLSVPVVLGVAGGVLLITGCAGLLGLRGREGRAERDLASPLSRSMAVSFLVLLLWVAVTGMLVLALRETGALETLLVLHLMGVGALFLTAPYGKLIHAVPRFAAIWRYHQRNASARP